MAFSTRNATAMTTRVYAYACVYRVGDAPDAAAPIHGGRVRAPSPTCGLCVARETCTPRQARGVRIVFGNETGRGTGKGEPNPCAEHTAREPRSRARKRRWERKKGEPLCLSSLLTPVSFTRWLGRTLILCDEVWGSAQSRGHDAPSAVREPPARLHPWPCRLFARGTHPRGDRLCVRRNAAYLSI